MCVQSACKFDFQHENNLVAFEGTGFCVYFIAPHNSMEAIKNYKEFLYFINNRT